jgi:hypothetical protein
MILTIRVVTSLELMGIFGVKLIEFWWIPLRP